MRTQRRLSYPAARTVDQIDEYHGVLVKDPYRWMEDLDDPELKPWLEDQERITEEFVSQIPCRAAFRDRLSALSRLSTVGVPRQRGGRWFQARSSRDDDQAKVFVLDRPDGDVRLLLDPNTFPKDVILMDFEASPDGSKLLFGESVGASDWRNWKIVDVETGDPLDDEVGDAKLWARWMPDGESFLYIAFPSDGTGVSRATFDPQLRIHRLGTPQGEDELVFEDPENPRYFYPSVSEDGRYLILTFLLAPGSEIAYAPIESGSSGGWDFQWVMKCPEQLWFLDNRDDTFFVATTYGAPYGRIVAIDLKDPDPGSWTTLVAETEVMLPPIGRSAICGDWLLTVRDQLGNSLMHLQRTDGSDSYEVDLPEFSHFLPQDSAKAVEVSEDGTRFYFSVTLPNSPGNLLEHDISSRKTELLFKPEGTPGLEVTAEQLWAKSRDGTMVPMTIVRAGGSPAPNPPVVIEGYGGGGDIMVPYSYSPWKVAWFESGGAVATAHLRGGLELGAEWQAAAERGKKVKAMEDFVACANHLVSTRWTTVERVAVTGRSSGGMLAAAAAINRPDLFAACVAEVGMFDPLRYHLFGLGRLMIAEYGTSDNPEDFHGMYEYSPLHRIHHDKSYPSFLLTVHGDDNRVPPGTAYKFAASLQGSEGMEAPVLIRFRAGAGHSAGTISGEIDERADILAFLGTTLGLPDCSSS